MTNVTVQRVVIVGRVQGVGFRAAFAAQARMYGVAGWVANRNDGAVVAQVEGPTPVVEALVAWCAQGPPAAAVDSVAVTDVEAQALTGFTIRRSVTV